MWYPWAGDRGVQTSRLLYFAFPSPTPFILFIFFPFFDCKILIIVAKLPPFYPATHPFRTPILVPIFSSWTPKRPSVVWSIASSIFVNKKCFVAFYCDFIAVFSWVHGKSELQMSTFHAGRFDQPQQASTWLQLCRTINSKIFSEVN